ncbi:MAG: hypothetical protein ACI9V8_000460 [Urechidicola sp.]|jgi:hypothetical protein
MKKFQITKARIFKNRYVKSSVSKLKATLVSTFLVLGLVMSPVQASHYRDVIAPLATVAALTYLFSHGHHNSRVTRKSYRSYSYSNNVRHHGHEQHSRRKHSHSSGGYSHKSNKRYQH